MGGVISNPLESFHKSPKWRRAMADEPSVLALWAGEPVGATSIDWPMPVRDRRRQETTVLDSQWEQNGSSGGAGLNATLPHPPQRRNERGPQPGGGPRF